MIYLKYQNDKKRNFEKIKIISIVSFYEAGFTLKDFKKN